MKSILSADLDLDFIKFFLVFNFILTLLISAFMYFVFSDKMAMGALFGGAISNLNCSGLYKDCIRTVKWQTIAAYYGGLAVRMGLIALAVIVLMIFLSNLFSFAGLFIGLSVGVINFYIIFFMMLLNKKNIFNKSYSQEVSK
jgi:hypothetical protein